MKEAYALKYDDKEVLMNSSSGGAFSALSDYILDNDGIVYGAIYDYESNYVVHSRATNSVERNLMRGSKYLQSNLRETFSQIEKDLKDGRTVLFTGTICQVSGLKLYLERNRVDLNELFTADIICHGVASPLIWKEYIEYKSPKKLLSLNFRCKEDGWASSRAVANNKDAIVDLKEYMRLFYSHTIMRPSCHACPFASTERCSEITIGDFWGIENLNISFDYIDGVSFIMVNNEKGGKLFNHVTSTNGKIVVNKVNVTDVNQPNFYAPTKSSIIRNRFWSDYREKGIKYIVRKYASNSSFYKWVVLGQKVIDLVKKHGGKKVETIDNHAGL